MTARNDLTGLNLPERLKAVLEVDPAVHALELNGQWCTWGDLAAGAGALGSRLREIGAPEGAKVGIVMRNRPGVIGAVVGALTARYSIVSLSPVQPPAALAREVGALGLVAVVADEDDWRAGELLAAAWSAGVLGLSVATYDPGRVKVITECALAPAEIGARALPGVAVSMLTSGTTGPPKRIPVSYRNLEASFAGSAHYESGRPWRARLRSGVAVLVAPVLHTSGLFRLLLNLLDGRGVAMLEKFTVDGLVRLVRSYDSQVLALTPTSLRMILDAEVDPEVFAHVRVVVCGTAPLKPDLAEEFEDRYGVAVLVMYGATEFAGGIAGWTLKDWQAFRRTKRGSVGRVHPGVGVRVRNPETGEITPPGEVGRLEVRSAQTASDSGDSESGAWQETTDLVRVDEDGFVWIVGRTDDVIIRGGFKVSTGMVAEVLKEHPSVRDAAVVGLPDRRLGEVPVAAIEVAEGAAFDPEALAAWARDRLSPYQVPTAFVGVADLPRTPSLKVSQQRVKELLTAGTDAESTADG
ncbi:class I adenylate-forming enzyme family protein [Sphaerimonospora mesophila]|uniref:class I adenylate-forming enzyme family protein n=1 Tax=Sphaerimonospora mesophila TaxID=37483 RepID=UPI0006E2EFFC